MFLWTIINIFFQFWEYIFQSSYINETIHTHVVVIDRKIQFTNCNFPNLRKIIIKYSDELPFHDCSFANPINLDIQVPISWSLPKEVVIQSTLEKNIYTPVQCDIVVYLKCGDSPRKGLQLFETRFGLNKGDIRIEEKYSNWITSDTQLSLSYHNKQIGVLCLKVHSDTFAKWILQRTDDSIYNGNIPDYWSNHISTTVRYEFNQLKELTINGNIGTQCFAKLDLNMDRLEITGEVQSDAFMLSNGNIGTVVINTAKKGSLRCNNISINNLIVGTLETGAKAEADTISIQSSNEIQGIQYVKTLIIREEFHELVDLQFISPSKLDLSTVTSTGPFTILNFGAISEIDIDEPGIIYEITNGTINASSISDAITKIEEELMETYTAHDFVLSQDDNTITVKVDHHEIGKWTIEIVPNYLPFYLFALILAIFMIN